MMRRDSSTISTRCTGSCSKGAVLDLLFSRPLLTLLVAVICVPLATVLARRIGAVAYPRADRFNSRAVPILGGLAIAAAIAAGTLLVPLGNLDKVSFLVGLAVMVALGLSDDLGSVSPRWRLAVESSVAILFVLAISGEFSLPLRVAAMAVAALAFPIVINATNLVDNADGLAASLSVVTALALAAMNVFSGVNSPAGDLGVVVAAALAGFLLYNLPPARVFMGDSGSLLLGFALAATSAFIVRDSLAMVGDAHKTVAIVLPFAWALQVGDLAMVFITRVRRGASPFRGGVDHTSHRLLAAGLGPWQMLAVLALIGTALAAAAIVAVTMGGNFRDVALVGVVLSAVVGTFEVVVARRLPPPEDPRKADAATADQPAAEPTSAARR